MKFKINSKISYTLVIDLPEGSQIISVEAQGSVRENLDKPPRERWLITYAEPVSQK